MKTKVSDAMTESMTTLEKLHPRIRLDFLDKATGGSIVAPALPETMINYGAMAISQARLPERTASGDLIRGPGHKPLQIAFGKPHIDLVISHMTETEQAPPEKLEALRDYYYQVLDSLEPATH